MTRFFFLLRFKFKYRNKIYLFFMIDLKFLKKNKKKKYFNIFLFVKLNIIDLEQV